MPLPSPSPQDPQEIEIRPAVAQNPAAAIFNFVTVRSPKVGVNVVASKDGAAVTAVGDISYDEFYEGSPRGGKIRPLGIGELLRVEQRLICYKAGEIAHIENVLQGEYKERSTRRLRRSEETYDLTVEREQTQERDTVTTDRYELAQETTRVLNQDDALTVGASVTGQFGPVKVEANSTFATSSSAEESDKQTASYAKSVTDRSLQRIVERVREQRTLKMIEEYEENNKHGLDNRTGSRHVVGVYRWVDKLYEAQVVNYGKRLMFEFMIPEPGNFHLWAMSSNASQHDSSSGLPSDPRKYNDLKIGSNSSSENPLIDHTKITINNYGAWAALYGASVTPPPDDIRVSKGFDGSVKTIQEVSDKNFSGTFEIEIQEGYEAKSADVTVTVHPHPQNTIDPGVLFFIGDKSKFISASLPEHQHTKNYPLIKGMVKKVPFSYLVKYSDLFFCNIEIECTPLPATMDSWKIKTYNAIIAAYQAKKDAYDQAVAETRAQSSINQIQGTNPSINQTLIQNELKKGCIHWLFEGDNFSNGGVNYPTDPKLAPFANTDKDIVDNMEKSMFIEQCFEWSLLTYTLYPYFWATKTRWDYLYKLTDPDPLFLNFLQSGMARVVVSVRSGYNEAVLHFLSTGEIWNGNPGRVSESALYNAVIQELTPKGNQLVGNPWEIRVPTTLTILQAESAVLNGKELTTKEEPLKALELGKPETLSGK